MRVGEVPGGKVWGKFPQKTGLPMHGLHNLSGKVDAYFFVALRWGKLPQKRDFRSKRDIGNT